MKAKINLHIVYRACDKIIARGAENINKTKAVKPSRPFTQDKIELVKVCFNSLKNSLELAKEKINYKIIVVGDCLSAELTAYFTKHQCQIVHGDFGNDNSLRQCFNFALTLPKNDWVYFCEDDYLHTEKAISVIIDLIINRNKIINFKPKKFRLIDVFNRFDNLPLFIHPTDYPDRYSDRSATRFSLIFQSPNPPYYSHWRQIQNTTFTFLCSVATAQQFQKKLLASCNSANDGLLSRIYRGTPSWQVAPRSLCVSPIPSLAAHLHPNTLPIGINWQEIFNNNFPAK